MCCAPILEQHFQKRERWRAQVTAERVQRIRERAYYVWEARKASKATGDQLGDWLAAEAAELQK
jgi:hypothetical protein